MLGPNGPECAKADQALAAVIAERLANGAMCAKGDNCSGPPEFQPNLDILIFKILKNDETA